MIVVVGKVRTNDEKRAELVRIGQAVAAASRAEDGCIDYRLLGDTERGDEFVFVEEWASDEALQAHFATPHIAEFMRAVPGAVVDAPDVKFHDVSGSRDLSNVTTS